MQSLYDQIGGEKTIELMITVFYQRVLADPMLLPFFEHTSIEKLQEMQKAFFTIALGGPAPELKMSIFEAHRGRGIERKHLTRFTEHLMETLKEIGVEDKAANGIYQKIATYADDVLGETSVDG